MKTSNIVSTVLAGLLNLFLLGAAQAQDASYSYQVLIDSDENSSTGCAVMPTGGAPVSGFEHRLLASVEVTGGTATVAALEQQDCTGSSFSAPFAVTLPAAPPWPVALEAGVSAGDAVELAVLSDAVSAVQGRRIQLVFVADDGNGSDVLATSDGSASGEDLFVFISFSPVTVPTLSWWGLLLLLTVLLATAWLAHRRMGRLAVVSTFMLVAGVAWAMHLQPDGDLSDWSGTLPLGQDPGGDATNAASGNDLVAGFAAYEEGMLFFRIDVVDLENLAPTANPDSYATNEDVPLNIAAPGVLGNDTDPESQPLNAVLAAGPGNAAAFALNADGSFSYTPQSDFNGSDSFSYAASDGALSSTPVTVNLSIEPVNDAPSFSAGPDQTALQGAGAQSVTGWASNIQDGDGGGQALTFDTSTSNDTLFSALPSVDAATGTLSFTPSSTNSGTATVTVILSDDGGTANGGVNQSAPAQFDITIEPIATAVDDAVGVTNGGSDSVNVLGNDSGPGLTAVSFGDSVANAGAVPADGTTTLSFATGGGTLDFTLNAGGQLNVTSNGTLGTGSVSIYYQVQSSNGSSDTGRIDVTYGDLPMAVDDSESTLGAGNEYSTDTGVDLIISAGTGMLNNDTLGTPAASLVQWGGGDASAAVDLTPGSARPFAGGTLTVNADGSFSLVQPTEFGIFGFDYIVANTIGSSQASVEIMVDGDDLAVTKVVDQPAPSENDTVVYRVTLENVGIRLAENIEVAEDLSLLAGVTYISDNSAALLDSNSNPTSYSSGTGIWTVGALDAGQSLTLEISATVDVGASALPQPRVNVASLSASNLPDQNPANDSDDAAIVVQ